jgi:uncharacterized protein (UPF0332 family)
MGDNMSSEFEKLKTDRKLLRERIGRTMIEKEMTAAQSDLQDARDSLEMIKHKWATIQGYYSMFHSARALLYSKGYREKSHHALLVAIRELFSKELKPSLIDKFEDAMNLRQEADYGLKFSQAGAEETIEGAEEILGVTKEILGIR